MPPRQLDNGLSFSTGYVVKRSLVLVAAQIDRLIEAEPHTVVLQLVDGRWSHFKINWPVVSMCSHPEIEASILSLGPHGQIHVAQANGFSEYRIDSSVSGPEHSGVLSELRTIGSAAFAVGMSRQVYRLHKGERWHRIDSTIRIPLESPLTTAFWSIDGFYEDDVYAVGDGGEIWHFDGSLWTSIDSPTDLALHKVLCVEPATVYAVGQCGTVLRRDSAAASWKVVDQTATRQDLWGLAAFEGRVYTCSNDAVFVIDGHGLNPIHVGAEGPAIAGQLDARDGVLWSFGTKSLSFFDGQEWKRVDAPRP